MTKKELQKQIDYLDKEIIDLKRKITMLEDYFNIKELGTVGDKELFKLYGFPVIEKDCINWRYVKKNNK